MCFVASEIYLKHTASQRMSREVSHKAACTLRNNGWLKGFYQLCYYMPINLHDMFKHLGFSVIYLLSILKNSTFDLPLFFSCRPMRKTLRNWLLTRPIWELQKQLTPNIPNVLTNAWKSAHSKELLLFSQYTWQIEKAKVQIQLASLQNLN